MPTWIRFGVFAIGLLLLTWIFATLNQSSVAHSFPDGAFPGIGFGPADGGLHCGNCHGEQDSARMKYDLISGIPNTGYIGGQTYTVSLLLQGFPGDTAFGYLVSAQTPTGQMAGTTIVTNTLEMQATGIPGTYVTHTLVGKSMPAHSKLLQFDWTAPPPGTGPVHFYAACLSRGDQALNVLAGQVWLTDYPMVEDTSQMGTLEREGREFLKVYPNPSQDQLFSPLFADAFAVLAIDISGHSSELSRQVGQAFVSVAHLKPGTYVLKIVGKFDTKSMIFIKK